MFYNRKTNRLKGYDYSSNGKYFITICSCNKENIFCTVDRRDSPCGCPELKLTSLGEIALDKITVVEEMFGVEFEKFIIMPNHIHAIIFIYNDEINIEDSRKGCPYEISDIVGAYKSLVANEWLRICKEKGAYMGKIWQRSYHDHIIRDDSDYEAIWEYIDNNPLKWKEDKLYIDED